MRIEEQTDIELLTSFREERVERDFTTLYNRYYVGLYKYISWYLNDNIVSKDVVQNVFIKVYEKPQLFDVNHNFKVWLYSIAKNAAKNEIRRKATSKRLIDALPAETNSAGTFNDSRLLKQQIDNALIQLSDVHREVFVLKYSNNLSINEISQICECSAGTVKSRLFYAIKKLKDVLKKDKIVSDEI